MISGTAPQPGGFDMISGDSGGGGEGSLIDFEVIDPVLKSVLLALYVHEAPDVQPAVNAETWNTQVENNGAGDFLLDIATRTVDGTTGSNDGDTASFFSELPQEIVGCLIEATSVLEDTVIESVASGAFIDDPNPAVPTCDSQLAENAIVIVIVADGEVELTPPVDCTEVEIYSSTPDPSKTFGVYVRPAGVAGEIDPGSIAASEAITGRVWVVVLHHTFAAVGPEGAAAFVLSLEGELTVTYSWGTDVEKAVNGIEQRICVGGDAPAQSYRGSAYLVDGDERTVRTAMLTAAAQGQPFLLALPFEELVLSGPAIGTVLPVWSTALSDWASNPGQRVAVLAGDGAIAFGVIQSAAADSITLDVAPGAAGKDGARVLPLMPVYLEPQQGLRRFPTSVAHWQLSARAALFGFAGELEMGIGAVVDTFDGLPVYSEYIDVAGQTESSIATLGRIVDAGGLPIAVGSATVIDQLRAISIVSTDEATWQWFKRFLWTVKGSFAAFLRPTWQPDLVFDSNPGGNALLVKSADVDGAGDYIEYFNSSLAHRRLQILKADGSIQRVVVSAVGDNADGTLTLTLDATVTDTVEMISFLETCRLEEDSAKVTWRRGWQFTCELTARVVQQ